MSISFLLLKLRQDIAVNSACAVDAQQVFHSTFTALKIHLLHLLNEGYSIDADTDRYQSVLEHPLSKVDFSIGT